VDGEGWIGSSRGLNRYGQRLVALHLKDFDANIHQPENAMPVFPI